MTSVRRTTSGTRWRYARRAHDQRDAQHALVEEDAVVHLAVLAGRFTMVSRNDDDHAIQEGPLLERVEQSADLRIGIGKFGNVRVLPRREGFRSCVRTMRIVEVRPPVPDLDPDRESLSPRMQEADRRWRPEGDAH